MDGRESAATSSSARRVLPSSPRTRSATSPPRVSGTRAASPGARLAPDSTRRPSSRACSGFPPDRSSTARSRARGRASPRRSRSIRPSASEVHRPELDPVDQVRSERILEPPRRGASGLVPARRDQPDRRPAEAAQRIAQRPRARLVEPLEIVDPEDDGRPARGLLQGPKDGDGDQEVHGRRAIRLGAEQHRLERPRLRGRQRRQRFVGEVRQEVDRARRRGERPRPRTGASRSSGARGGAPPRAPRSRAPSCRSRARPR